MTRLARWTLVVLTSLTAATTSLSAQTAARLAADGVVPGARVRVHHRAGPIVEGKVVALSDSLLVVVATGAPTVTDSVPLAQVTSLRLRRSPPLLLGGVTGAVVGAIAGYAWASSHDTDDPVAVPAVTTLGLIGAGLGVGAAALLPRWRDVPLRGASP